MAVKFRDYYQSLGVPRGASQDEIRKAYRKLAREFHPDMNKAPQAEARFKEVNEAYEVLGDKDKRAKYDQLGENWKQGQEFRPPPGFEGFDFRRGGGPTGPGGATFEFRGGDFSDFFEAVFGARGGAGGGHGMGDFEEMLGRAAGAGGASGGTSGGASGGRGRRGRNPFEQAHAPGLDQGQDVTSEITIGLEDAYHGGSRQLSLQMPDGQTRSLEVKIPAGATDGSTLRLKGQGVPAGGNGASAGGGGDLLLKINIAPHPQFTLQGHDLTTMVPLSPWEAALGAKVPVTTLEGQVTLTIPPGSQSGQRLRLRGKGMPKRGGEKGDLFVELRIIVPKTLTDEERTLLEQLREKSKFDPRA
ncbi:MAG: DnaJ C-terminal domain-containing protein [Phycisphaeraceae bacterium]